MYTYFLASPINGINAIDTETKIVKGSIVELEGRVYNAFHAYTDNGIECIDLRFQAKPLPIKAVKHKPRKFKIYRGISGIVAAEAVLDINVVGDIVQIKDRFFKIEQADPSRDEMYSREIKVVVAIE